MGPNGEPLNETRYFTWVNDTTHWHRDGPGIVIRGVHKVSVAPYARAGRKWREAHESIFRQPVLAFATPWSKADRLHASAPPSGLARPLPSNVAVLSLERLEAADTLLLRLMHRYGIGEDEERSANISVPLRGLFSRFDVLNVTELLLFANAKKEERARSRMRWRTNEEEVGEKEEMAELPPPIAPSFDVLLTPLKIRTFRLKVGSKRGLSRKTENFKVA